MDTGALNRNAAASPAETPLYAARVRVYPRAVSGRWRLIKWAALALLLGIYYAVPWLRWHRGPGLPDQAILLDLDGRRGWFFDTVIWPQEVYFITGLMIMGAFGLFLATSLFGRVWCGFACPQTVWTDLFMAVERLIEGDRNTRMRRDRGPLSFDKAARKTAKHLAWLAIAAATGGAWVFYFIDAPTAFAEIFRGQAATETYFFAGLLTATTYLLAGWAREQVCTYMCPWPRFQAAMLDEQSLIVTYEKWRGEPRGKHKAGARWDGRGDCVDCNLCVAVCPMGIDIRDGQQLECIGCGLCVDACNGTMDKVARPRGLIRWDTLARQRVREAGQGSLAWRLLRPRTILYGALLAAVAAVMLFVFIQRSDTDLAVQRDRSPNFVRLSNGDIRNSYAIKISNKTRAERQFRLAVENLPGATLAIANAVDEQGAVSHLPAPANAVATYRVLVTVPARAVHPGSTSIDFTITAGTGRPRATHDSVFVGPAS
ncbi:MAG: cytochrome c oxidase accessory protein CcoG [Alphaproteobacteria bacterium]|nr:cytochrome c oxidase accessory protein CcoG [Alphaproteobacteria bacterium]